MLRSKRSLRSEAVYGKGMVISASPLNNFQLILAEHNVIGNEYTSQTMKRMYHTPEEIRRTGCIHKNLQRIEFPERNPQALDDLVRFVSMLVRTDQFLCHKNVTVTCTGEIPRSLYVIRYGIRNALGYDMKIKGNQITFFTIPENEMDNKYFNSNVYED